MIISNDAEKTSDKSTHAHYKNSHKTETGQLPQLDTEEAQGASSQPSICWHSTEHTPQHKGQGDVRPHHLLNIVLGVSAARPEEETKGTQMRKEAIQQSLFADNMAVDIENIKESTKTLLEEVSPRSQCIRQTYRNHFYPYTLAINTQKSEVKIQYHNHSKA